MSGPWTLWNGGQTLCLNCKRKIGTKPGTNCPESRHAAKYKRNAEATGVRRDAAQQEALEHYSNGTPLEPPCCVLC